MNKKSIMMGLLIVSFFIGFKLHAKANKCLKTINKYEVDMDRSWDNLRGTYWPCEDLRGVDFYGALLNNAVFRGADLRNSDLRDADLTGANFKGAMLEGAKIRTYQKKYFTANQLKKMVIVK